MGHEMWAQVEQLALARKDRGWACGEDRDCVPTAAPALKPGAWGGEENERYLQKPPWE